MVKERRAMADEAVNLRAPEEGLRVPDRKAISYESRIEAERIKSGIWLNPTIHKNIGSIFDDFQKLKRDEIKNNWYVEFKDREREYEALKKEQEKYDKYLLNKRHLDLALELDADITDTREEATKTGKNVVEEFNKLKSKKWDPMLDDIYSLDPKLATTFQTTYQASFTDAADKARVFEYSKAKEANKFSIQKLTSFGTIDIIGGITRDSVPQEDLNKNLKLVGQHLMPLLDGNLDTDYLTANNTYNELIFATAKRVESDVSQNKMTAQEGSDFVSKVLLGGYAAYTFKGPIYNEDGEIVGEREIPVHITPETQGKIVGVSNSFLKKESQKAKANKVYTLNSYKDLVKTPRYFMDATPASAKEDFTNSVFELLKGMGSGNEDASNQMYEMAFLYWTEVAPKVMAYEIAQGELAITGNIYEARVILDKKIETLQEALDNGEDPGTLGVLNFSYPEYGIEGSLAFPDEEGSLNALYRNGVPTNTEKKVYYNALLGHLREVRKGLNADSSLLHNFSNPYMRSVEKVNGFLSYHTICSENASSDTIMPNLEGKKNLTDFLKEMGVQEQAATGNNIAGVIPSSVFETIYSQAAILDSRKRTIYLSILAECFKDAGYGGSMLTYKTQDLTSEEKAIAQELGMWQVLNADPDTRDIIGHIKYGFLDTEKPRLTNVFMDQAFKDKVTNNPDKSFTEGVEAKLERVPIGYRPFVRAAIKEIAYAKVYGPRKDGSVSEEKFDMDFVDTFIQNRFTERGTPTFIGVVKTPADARRIDENISSIEKVMAPTYKQLNVEGMSTVFDPETGNVQLLLNGNPIVGAGTYAKLRDAGIVPFAINVTNKPAGMSWDEFYEAQKPILAVLPIMVGLAKIEENSVLMKRMLDAGYTPDDIQQAKKYALQFAAAVGKEDIIQSYYQYRLSGNKNTEIASAPNFLVDTIARSAGLSKNRELSADVTNFLDFVWSKQGLTKLQEDLPGTLSYELKGVPLAEMEVSLNKSGWGFTSTTGGKHVPGSKHGKGFAADIGDITGKGFYNAFVDPFTGNLKEIPMKNLYTGFLEPQATAGRLDRVLTGYPYLDPRRPESKDPRYKNFQYLRDLKNKDKQPVFRYVEPFELNGRTVNHRDHFHAEFYDQTFDTRTGKPLNTKYTEENKNKMGHVLYTSINSSRKFGTITKEESRAITSFSDKYEITDWDAKNTGIPLDKLKKNAMGQELSVAALYGKTKSLLGTEMAQYIVVAGPSKVKFVLQPVTKEAQKMLKEVKDLSIKDILAANDRLKSRGLSLKEHFHVQVQSTPINIGNYGHNLVTEEDTAFIYANQFKKEMYK